MAGKSFTITRRDPLTLDPRRFAILDRIAASVEWPCQSLCAEFPVSKATLSHHLRELETAGLVTMRKDGKFAHLALKKKLG